MPITDWSTTAADNDDADIGSGIDWRELMQAGQVNNTGRAMMAVLAQYRDSVADGTVLDGRYIKRDGSNFGAFAFRNPIINGDFRIWQRGTSLTGAGYLADRFYVGLNSGTLTQSRVSFNPGDGIDNPKFGLRINATGVVGAYVRQFIEGARTFAGKTVTVSFRMRVSTGVQLVDRVYFRQFFGTGGSPSAQVDTSAQTFTVTNDGLISATIGIPSIAGKTLGTNGDDSLSLIIGSSGLSTTGDNIIYNIQVEEGSAATQFASRPIAQELVLCQRYYQKSYSQPDAPGTVTTSGAIRFRADGTSVGQFISTIFPVTMRAAPTLTPYSTETGESAKIYNYSSGNAVSCTLAGGGDRGFNSVTVGGSPADSNSYGFHYTADAEL